MEKTNIQIPYRSAPSLRTMKRWMTRPMKILTPTPSQPQSTLVTNRSPRPDGGAWSSAVVSAIASLHLIRPASPAVRETFTSHDTGGAIPEQSTLPLPALPRDHLQVQIPNQPRQIRLVDTERLGRRLMTP